MKHYYVKVKEEKTEVEDVTLKQGDPVDLVIGFGTRPTRMTVLGISHAELILQANAGLNNAIYRAERSMANPREIKRFYRIDDGAVSVSVAGLSAGSLGWYGRRANRKVVEVEKRVAIGTKISNSRYRASIEHVCSDGSLVLNIAHANRCVLLSITDTDMAKTYGLEAK